MSEQTHTNRWMVAILGILMLVLLSALMIGTTFLWWGRCGGDGGYPFSARASEMGKVCETVYLPQGTIIITIGFILLAIAVGVFGFAMVRRRIRAIAVVAVIGIMIHAALLIPVFTLDGDCTNEQRQSLSARECQTYN